MSAEAYPREPELAQEAPRRVRYKQTIRRMRLWLASLFGLLTVLMLVLALDDLWELSALHVGGKAITAYVTEKRVESRQNSEAYYLDFAFQVNGSTYKGTVSRAKSEWDNIRNGGALPLVYLPSNPNVHRFGTAIAAQEVQNRQRFWVGLDGSFLLALGGILAGLEIGLRRERALLRNGVAVAAEIVSGVPLANSPSASRRVTFQYPISPTESKRKTLLLPALTANRLAGRYSVIALYDPAHPQQVRLYPLFEAVELA